MNPYVVKDIEFLVNFNNFSFKTISVVMMSMVIVSNHNDKFGLSMRTKADCDAMNIN